MKYLVIGAGGTGGALGAYLTRGGKDVTVLARGAHLQAMQEKGLTMKTVGGTYTVPVKACAEADYTEKPDVVFVCVKGYSLDSVVPVIERVSGPDTVVIPILNIYGTGRELQKVLPGTNVTDGCIYIAAQKDGPGEILMSGNIFRVVFGLRKDATDELKAKVNPVLAAVEKDLADSGITPLFSSFIEKDCLQKFSFVSPMAAIGATYGAKGIDYQTNPLRREEFITMVREVEALSHAMGAALPENIVDINLKIMDDLAPGASSSMQRDIEAGYPSEIDGLVHRVCEYGKEFGVEMPTYEALSRGFKERGLV